MRLLSGLFLVWVCGVTVLWGAANKEADPEFYDFAVTSELIRDVTLEVRVYLGEVSQMKSEVGNILAEDFEVYFFEQIEDYELVEYLRGKAWGKLPEVVVKQGEFINLSEHAELKGKSGFLLGVVELGQFGPGERVSLASYRSHGMLIDGEVVYGEPWSNFLDWKERAIEWTQERPEVLKKEKVFELEGLDVAVKTIRDVVVMRPEWMERNKAPVGWSRGKKVKGMTYRPRLKQEVVLMAKPRGWLRGIFGGKNR